MFREYCWGPAGRGWAGVCAGPHNLLQPGEPQDVGRLPWEPQDVGMLPGEPQDVGLLPGEPQDVGLLRQENVHLRRQSFKTRPEEFKIHIRRLTRLYFWEHQTPFLVPSLNNASEVQPFLPQAQDAGKLTNEVKLTFLLPTDNEWFRRILLKKFTWIKIRYLRYVYFSLVR